MADAVAFMRWERVVPWKVLSLAAFPDAVPVPIGYGARNRNFAEQLKPGSRIWVVTRIAREFSLAGKVVVQEMFDRSKLPEGQWPQDLASLLVQWRYVARADPARSEFLETNIAEPVIARHGIRFAQNRTVVFSDTSLGGSFAECVQQGRRTVFLSYRWAEARRFAFALARELRKRGFSPWLDALTVPGYEERGDPGVTAARLERLIQLGISSSKFAVIVNTETYGRTKWTTMEREQIRAADIPCYQVMRGGKPLRFDAPPVHSRKPDEAVEEILQQHTPR